MLFAGRILLGLGCAASFMGAVVLTSRWVRPDRFTQVLSWVFALSNIGTLLATTPMAMGSEAIGWRGVFVLSAVASAAVGALFLAVVRDAPTGAGTAGRPPETLLEVLRGVGEIWRTPGLGSRSAERRAGTACVRKCRSRWWPYH